MGAKNTNLLTTCLLSWVVPATACGDESGSMDDFGSSGFPPPSTGADSSGTASASSGTATDGGAGETSGDTADTRDATTSGSGGGGTDSGPATTGGGSGDSTTGSDATSGEDGTTASGGTDTGSGDSGVRFDVGGETTGNPGGEGSGGEGCRKIDFLFVIDNSNSMSDEQQLLADAFPAFVDAIENALPDATDFHVGVTKTDVFGFDSSPTPDPANPCPYTMGGLLSHATEPDGMSGIGSSCGFSSGENYMVNSPTLAAEFSCAALVGTRGNTGETQAEATLAALAPAATGPGGCSEGFLRDDALLVVVLITDEDDDWSEPDADQATNVQAWFDGLASAKGGVEENLAFVLISGGNPRWPTCAPLDLQTKTGADTSPGLTAWATRFSNHALGNVCEAGYDTALTDAISTIETACDGFDPVG